MATNQCWHCLRQESESCGMEPYDKRFCPRVPDNDRYPTVTIKNKTRILSLVRMTKPFYLKSNGDTYLVHRSGMVMTTPIMHIKYFLEKASVVVSDIGVSVSLDDIVKKRGRPSKAIEKGKARDKLLNEGVIKITPEPGKRGRPKKEEEIGQAVKIPKKRGRPKKEVSNVSVEETPKKKRGRPRKNS